MKLNELFETAATGMTSVASIGRVEYAAFPNRIELYKRNKENCPTCVAKIRRKKGAGWSLITTKEWGGNNLPHFGQLHNIKTPTNGMKSISNDLSRMLTTWGIKVDELIKKGK